MRILVVSSYLPFPLDSGGHVRLYNILKELSKGHQVTLVCEKRPHQTHEDIEEVKKFCEEVITIPRKKQWSVENIRKAGFSTYPFLMTGHSLPEMKRKIVEVLAAKRFDLIHVETFYVYQNLPKTYLPVVLVEHNIEYKVYEKFANNSNILLRPFLLADILKIKRWEESFWKKATKVVAVSEEERIQMTGVDAALVPNGVDTQKFKMQNEKLKMKRKEKRVLFIGNFKWIQNQKAAQKILTDIWPKVLEELDEEMRKNTMLWIVGKHIPSSIKAFQSKSILIDENAPDATEKIYQKADVLLAPLEVGGGSSYKILEAMASGVPVVTSVLGITGISGIPGEHALVGKSDDELAKAVLDLLQKKTISEKMIEAARKFVESTYNWQVITKALEQVYEEAIQLTL